MTSDKFYPLDIEHLYQIVLKGIQNRQLFGIPAPLWHLHHDRRLETSWMGSALGNPLGPAAGPHTQMAQNIIVAWLCGARYIELKTIQVLDDLHITKPCIDMSDEGYNCEWSQELPIEHSFNEYLKAWIIIHLIEKELNMPASPCMFNMSVGYNLDGIQSDKVQQFITKMRNCHSEKGKLLSQLKSVCTVFPDVPDLIAGTVTLSTMHGCPPDEIEKIARFLMDMGLHTIVKLNPTLLGPERVREILNKSLGYKTIVPDSAFGHDLKFDQAVDLVNGLKQYATSKGVHFGIKLSNTLECINTNMFDASNQTMYMSGKALHPVTVELAKALLDVFGYDFPVSFSAGADCFNFPQLIACGFNPVTVCSDILKPGGYGRLPQYLSRLSESMDATASESIDQYKINASGIKTNDVTEAAGINLGEYARQACNNKEYRRKPPQNKGIKTTRTLGFFDCIAAPCMSQCATNQHIPGYLFHSAQGDFKKAVEIVLGDNPFPHVTGKICDHLCQLKCTRMNIDESLRIREVKNFISTWSDSVALQQPAQIAGKVAIIGAGPSGLSCAYYLTQHGFTCDVFEKTGKPGGMISWAIPPFRISVDDIMADVSRITQSGVKIHYQVAVDAEMTSRFLKEYDFVYVSTGAWQPVSLGIEGLESEGVVEPLEILFQVNEQKRPVLGKQIAIIGGGNTAVDAARTAIRLVGGKGKVTLLYRRTRDEMPADISEIEAAMDEGIELIELLIPEKIVSEKGKVTGVLCAKAALSGKDASGRPKPVKIEGSEFVFECDTVIPAIGQKQNTGFLTHLNPVINPEDGSTNIPGLFIGGDALRGPATAIKAIADGKKAAKMIFSRFSGIQKSDSDGVSTSVEPDQILKKQATRQFSLLKEIEHTLSFDLPGNSAKPQEIPAEASRCLQCDAFCNICVSVCPNRAMHGYRVKPVEYQLKKAVLHGKEMVFEDDVVFKVDQHFQVINIIDFCNECGNCSTFCPTSGRPFADKPRFCLSHESLKSNNEVYFMSRLKDRTVLIYKDESGIKTLTRQGNEFHYETDHVWAVFDQEQFKIKAARFRTPCVRQSQFRFAAEMSVLFYAAEGMMP